MTAHMTTITATGLWPPGMSFVLVVQIQECGCPFLAP